ncbi:hypothetical protein [Halohasta litorea]|uniref:Rod shape-determining protein MreD n=1 Tax=Halohasta litorea TaxID=869891 RepID=A0ABD6D272_9EURY|nr:hypothetical protein [Halohasta litorea]
MVLEGFKKEVDVPRPELEPLLQHRFLTPPYGYVLGVLLWPVFDVLISVWFGLSQSGLLSIPDPIGGLVVLGGFVGTSVSSALVMGLTAWNTPDEHRRRYFALLLLCLLFGILLFRLHTTFTTILRFELGVSLFASHELSKIVFRGPALGLVSAFYALVVLSFRYLFK